MKQLKEFLKALKNLKKAKKTGLYGLFVADSHIYSYGYDPEDDVYILCRLRTLEARYDSKAKRIAKVIARIKVRGE